MSSHNKTNVAVEEEGEGVLFTKREYPDSLHNASCNAVQ